MRTALIGFCATTAIMLSLIAAGQGKVTPPAKAPTAKQIAAMRDLANRNARALATAVQASAISNGKYNSVMSDYARDMGGQIPVNPCTGTRTGYTMVITNNGHSSVVSAAAGKNCGKWTPQLYKLTL